MANSNGPAGTSPESSKWSFDTGGGGWGNEVQGQAESATPLSAGFHTYSVEWEPERISFMLDGSVYKTITPADLPAGAAWPFKHPYFLLPAPGRRRRRGMARLTERLHPLPRADARRLGARMAVNSYRIDAL